MSGRGMVRRATAAGIGLRLLPTGWACSTNATGHDRRESWSARTAATSETAIAVRHVTRTPTNPISRNAAAKAPVAAPIVLTAYSRAVVLPNVSLS